MRLVIALALSACNADFFDSHDSPWERSVCADFHDGTRVDVEYRMHMVLTKASAEYRVLLTHDGGRTWTEATTGIGPDHFHASDVTCTRHGTTLRLVDQLGYGVEERAGKLVPVKGG